MSTMKPITDQELQLAEIAARVIVMAEEIGVIVMAEEIGPRAFRLLARAYVNLRDQVRALHDLIDLTDPHDPIGVALTKVGLECRPPDSAAEAEPRLVRSPEEVAAMSGDDLVALYCHVMREPAQVFAKHDRYVVRQWDGMDGCWTDCTAEVGQEEALRYWAARTDGGARRVAYSEIDYYRIFPGGARMNWDGSEGREMHR